MFFRFLTAQLSVGLTAVVAFLLIKLHQILVPLVESENVKYGFDLTNYGFQKSSPNLVGERNLDQDSRYLRGFSNNANSRNGNNISFSPSYSSSSVPYSSSSSSSLSSSFSSFSSSSYSGESQYVHGYTTEQRWELWVNRWNLLIGKNTIFFKLPYQTSTWKLNKIIIYICTYICFSIHVMYFSVKMALNFLYT